MFLQLIPVLGWFISMGIFVDFVKAFGKFKLYEHALAALLPVVYFPYIGFNSHTFHGEDFALERFSVRE